MAQIAGANTFGIAGTFVCGPICGVISWTGGLIITTIVLNEVVDAVSDDEGGQSEGAGGSSEGAGSDEGGVEEYIAGLKENSVPDPVTGNPKVRSFKGENSVDEAYDNFPGEERETASGTRIKVAKDGTSAHVHNSTKDNGRKTISIRRPGSRIPIKIRDK